MKETIMMYSVEQVDADSINLETHNFENYKLVINDQLFFDTLLMLIRGETISYSSMKKKKCSQREKNIETEISKLESDLSHTEYENNILEELEYKKACLEDIRKQKIDEAKLRSKLKWIEYGEKPSKFFLNLEKQNFVNRQIKKLIDDKGNVIKDKDILSETSTFYSNLYIKNPEEDFNWNALDNFQVPKLNANLRNSLEGPLSMEKFST